MEREIMALNLQTGLNYINYDRLVQHLRTMDWKKFAYESNQLSVNANCVACHIIALEPGHPTEWIAAGNCGSAEAIRQFLGVTHEEASYIYGRLGTTFDPPGPDMPYTFWRGRGKPGIAEALRRLAIVAARYQRPVETEAPTSALPAFQPNEQAFLDSIRSLVASAEIGGARDE